MGHEHRYLFSRAEHRELFKADPVRYAPQFANFCAMSLTRGELVEANPENWLVSGGKRNLVPVNEETAAIQIQDIAIESQPLCLAISHRFATHAMLINKRRSAPAIRQG